MNDLNKQADDGFSIYDDDEHSPSDEEMHRRTIERLCDSEGWSRINEDGTLTPLVPQKER